MIIGHGLVASAFASAMETRDDTIVFASGVSNSKETRIEEFAREERMLRENIGQDKLLLYFGSCSLFDPEMADTPYVAHKTRMEALVRDAKRFAIFRLPQVVGRSKNPTLLTNFLYTKIASGEHFNVWAHARRNIIDVDDVAAIGLALVSGRHAVGRVHNIACPFSVPVLEIVQLFERVLGATANYSLVDAGASYSIDASAAQTVGQELGIKFDRDYVERIIRKYYGK